MTSGGGCYSYVYQEIRCEFCERVIRIDQRVYMMNDKPFCGELCRDRHRRTYNGKQKKGVDGLPVIPSSLVDLY